MSGFGRLERIPQSIVLRRYLATPFSLDRFEEGRMIDESVAAAVAH